VRCVWNARSGATGTGPLVPDSQPSRVTPAAPDPLIRTAGLVRRYRMGREMVEALRYE
jgi:hypothetical protein